MGKDVAEDYLKLSIAKLRELDYLDGFRSGSVRWTWGMSESKSNISISVSTYPEDMYVRLWYTSTDRWTHEKKDFDYKVPLTTAPCNYGGVRYWFVCPLYKNGVYCGKRVAVLYGGRWFGCRHCHDLSYESRNESSRFRGYPFRVITDDNKLEELYKRLKRRTYAGKPTKIYQKILNLEHRNFRLGGSDDAWAKIEGLL